MRGSGSVVALVMVAACSSFGESGGGATAVDAGAPLDGASAEAAPQDGSYAQAVLADGPIAYFRFEDGPSSNVVRSEVGTFKGTLLGAAKLGAPGPLRDRASAALQLGEGDGVSFGQVFDFTGTAPFTFEAWALPKKIDDQYRALFDQEVQSGGKQLEVHNVYVHGGEIAFERFVAGDGVTAIAPVQTDAWVHVAAVYTGGMLQLFLDGRLVDEQADVRPANPKPVGFYVGDSPFQDGWVGLVDEVAIYDKALAAERIKAHVDAR